MKDNDLSSLPPLPQPSCKQHLQSLFGCSLVSGCAYVYIAVIKFFATFDDFPETLFLVLIYVQGCIAVLCLVGLLVADPGVVNRSEDSCFPLPDVVAKRIMTKKPLTDLKNITDGDLKYCVRCLVWRDPFMRNEKGYTALSHRRIHHCRICERCVCEFDHHCSVFGRCIAGHGFVKGNWCFFVGLVAVGISGGFTCTAAFFMAACGTHSN